MINWPHSHTINIDDYYGFVYRVTDLHNNMEYIGKKTFWFRVAKKPLKGRKNRRLSKKESDWKTYTTSSKIINALIEEHGMERFKFEIIKLCKTKMELRYNEVKIQWENLVLEARLPNGEYKFYNGQIDSVRRKI